MLLPTGAFAALGFAGGVLPDPAEPASFGASVFAGFFLATVAVVVVAPVTVAVAWVPGMLVGARREQSEQVHRDTLRGLSYAREHEVAQERHGHLRLLRVGPILQVHASLPAASPRS